MNPKLSLNVKNCVVNVLTGSKLVQKWSKIQKSKKKMVTCSQIMVKNGPKVTKKWPKKSFLHRWRCADFNSKQTNTNQSSFFFHFLAMDVIEHYKKKLLRHIDEPEVVLYCLKKLESVPVTIQILQDSEVGKVVNRLKKRSDTTPDVILASKGLVEKWKELVKNADDEQEEQKSVPEVILWGIFALLATGCNKIPKGNLSKILRIFSLFLKPYKNLNAGFSRFNARQMRSPT